MKWAQIYDTATGQPIGPVHGFTPKEALPELEDGQAWAELPGPDHTVALKRGVAEAVKRAPKVRQTVTPPASLDAVKTEDEGRAYIRARGAENVLLELLLLKASTETR